MFILEDESTKTKFNMLLAEIQHKIQNAKALDFGQIFNESIELFKNVWLQGFIIVLLSIGLSIPFVIILYAPLIILGIIDGTNPSMVDNIAPLMMLVFILLYLIMMVVLMAIALGLKAAFFRILFQKDMNLEAKEDYFFFLRKPYLGKTISLSIAYFGISIIATLLCFFPIIYAIVPLNLLIVVYAFNPGLTVSNLVKVSFELGNKKWFITFGLLIVAIILAEMVGLLMCGIGIFVTMSFVSIPLYFIYKYVVGFESPEFTTIQGNLNN